jgi:hypothetical protein
LDSPDAFIPNATAIEDLGTTNDISDVGQLAVGELGVTGTITTEDTMLVTTGGVTITLPDASTVGSGSVVYIKDRDGSASGDPITVDTQSAQTIDGLSSLLMDTDHESVTFLSDGSNWSVL